MTSTFMKRQMRPFSQLKGRIFGTPERSLAEAYQAALTIKSIEDEYFDGGKVLTTLLDDGTSTTSPLPEIFEKNLIFLKQKMKEFDASSSVLGRLGQDHLMKLVFAEGVLAKYAIERSSSQSSALVPLSNTRIAPKQFNTQAHPTVNIIDVPSTPDTLRVKPKLVRTKANKSTLQSDVGLDAEKPGVLPRSVERTISKIKNDLNPKAEAEVVKKFRSSREKTIIGLRLLSLLIVIPLITQQISKQFLVKPVVTQMRASEMTPVFLNSEMKEEALKELHTFEEELKLASLIGSAPPIAPAVMEEKVKHKAIEITEQFHHKSNDAISNVFADLIAVVAFALVLLFRRKDISVLKSFMDNIVSGLSDSAKAFTIILITDIFVGFHSPHGWEVLLEGVSSHLGIAANRGLIFLFIATVPVILATIFKYWVFRSLSRMSPSTVATLKEMND